VALTVTTTVLVALHVPLVPVTVYVFVVAGLAVTAAPVVALNPVAGLHEYVVAPLAVRLTGLPPEHIVAEGGVTVTVGVGLTVITTDCVSLQPPLTPVTVYVVVVAGVAVTPAPVVVLRPVAGLHE